MKIAIVGCGALGSYYGAALLGAGAEVHFLLRSDLAVVRREGVRILTAEGEIRRHPQTAATPEEIGVCDLVVIALKTTANDQFRVLLPPLIGPATRLLTLQNGLGNEAALAAQFGAERVLGGLCFVCLNRIAPGVIHHLAHGLIVLGEFGRPATPATHDLAALFRRGGIPCRVTENLAAAHWEKLVWNIPFNGLGVAGAAGYPALEAGRVDPAAPLIPCLATDALLGDARWEAAVRALMHEVLAAAQALGLPLDAGIAENQITRTREMGRYLASTLLDFQNGRPLELESLFREPWRQAQAAGVPTPWLTRLCGVLGDLDSRRLPAGGASS